MVEPGLELRKFGFTPPSCVKTHTFTRAFPHHGAVIPSLFTSHLFIGKTNGIQEMDPMSSPIMPEGPHGHPARPCVSPPAPHQCPLLVKLLKIALAPGVPVLLESPRRKKKKPKSTSVLGQIGFTVRGQWQLTAR